MEGFEYIKNKNTIEGINLNSLEKLVTNKSYNQYTVKKIINNSIIAYDSNKGKICMVNCVKNYYELREDMDCNEIKRELFDSYSDCNCDKCHLKAIELWKKQKLTKR